MDCNPAYQRVLSPQFSPHCGCWEFEPAVGVSLSKAIGGSSTHWSSICHEFPSVQILYPYTSLGERCNVQCSGESAPLFNGAGPITKCVGGHQKSLCHQVVFFVWKKEEEILRLGFNGLDPLVNIQKAMENHHFSWVNPLFQWPCWIAMLVYRRVSGISGSSDVFFLLHLCWQPVSMYLMDSQQKNLVSQAGARAIAQ